MLNLRCAVLVNNVVKLFGRNIDVGLFMDHIRVSI